MDTHAQVFQMIYEGIKATSLSWQQNLYKGYTFATPGPIPTIEKETCHRHNKATQNRFLYFTV